MEAKDCFIVVLLLLIVWLYTKPCDHTRAEHPAVAAAKEADAAAADASAVAAVAAAPAVAPATAPAAATDAAAKTVAEYMAMRPAVSQFW